MESFYDALIDEEICVEEELLRAKEAEFLAAIAPPPSIEEPASLAEVPSSSGVREAPEGSPGDPAAEILPNPIPTVTSPVVAAVSSSTSLPFIELTSPGSSGKLIAEISTGKHPGRKLTRAPPSKRRLILPADELVSEGFASAGLPSDEPMLAELYPSLNFPASPFSSASASGDVSFTFPLSIPTSGSLPSSSSSYLVFAPPSIPTSSFSAGSSAIPVLPILLGGSFASSWDEVRPLFEEISIPEAIDRFSHKENQVCSLTLIFYFSTIIL